MLKKIILFSIIIFITGCNKYNNTNIDKGIDKTKKIDILYEDKSIKTEEKGLGISGEKEKGKVLNGFKK